MKHKKLGGIAALLLLSMGCVSERSAAPREPAPRPSTPVAAPPNATPTPPIEAAASGRASAGDPDVPDAGHEAPPGRAPPGDEGTCPGAMIHVRGRYCTEVEQTCVDWMEPPTKGGVGRCRRFDKSVCRGPRVAMDFCIDRDEHEEESGLPMAFVSWTQAKDVCEGEGKRLCKESEWNFACEGEEMLPYPIGYERDATKCNYDQMKLLDAFGKPVDHRRPARALAQCVSPFGVRNMTGNVDEWTVRDVMNGPWRSALKGGWWMAARNRCRPATTAHDELYRDFQTGFRCCAPARTRP